MRRVLVLINLVFWIPVIGSFGQTPRIDSLRRLVYTAVDEKGRLKALLAVLEENESLPKDTLWDYALWSRRLAAATGDAGSISRAILAEARAYLRWDNTDSARILIESELAKYKAGDAATRDIYFELARARIDCIGNAFNYKDAIAQVYDVMREGEKYKDSVVIAGCMNTLAAWNYDMDFLAESRQWSYKALGTISETPRFFSVLVSIYLNLGENYRWIGKIDSAEYCTNKGVEYARRMGNLFYQSVGLQKLAAIDIDKKEYTEAERAIRQSMQLIEKVEGRAPQQEKLLVLASVYRHAGQTDKAIRVLNDGLAADSAWKKNAAHQKSSADTGDLQRVFYYDLLAKCYKEKGDSKNYQATLEKIIAGKDEFYKANSASAIAELETKYEFQKKEAMIAQQRLALLQDRYLLYASILVVVLGGFIAWLLFFNYRRRQRLNLLRLQEEEKHRATLAVAVAEETERRRIAADLHDNLGAQLSFIKRNVNFILDQPEGWDPGNERKYLGYVNDTAQNAMIDLRETIWVLNRDLVDVQEFADKLKSYLRQQLLGRELIRWNFVEDIRQSWKLSSGEVMHLFRIVQEVISNIIKHAGADEILIRMESAAAGCYLLEISDNGKGFDVHVNYEGHYGMENIQRRAREIGARLLVESRPMSGTRVLLEKAENNTFALLNGAGNAGNIAS